MDHVRHALMDVGMDLTIEADLLVCFILQKGIADLELPSDAIGMCVD